MVDIDALSQSENLTTSLQPVERRFKAEGKTFSCSFVIGFPYILANGKAVKLNSSTTYEDDTVWAPAQETIEIFSAAFSKNYTLDSANKVLKIVEAKSTPQNTVAL